MLLESRNRYSALRDEHLRYIKHPEKLAESWLDPLTDVPNSPWALLRQDERIRAEILQDVRRLPDQPFYNGEQVQTMILDILFLYCKVHAECGGYRQGMHELLAPVIYVVAQDAIDRDAIPTEVPLDCCMVEMLDSYFVEHDAYALFCKIMSRAGLFYETGDETGQQGAFSGQKANFIVERSKVIHELALARIDPELAKHLKNIEVLPQTFLLVSRWIRLLFGREFPFEDVLCLWDALFAFDRKLELVDLVCVAMLIRIRWTLLEADYSIALQVLLKYPLPPAPHGPRTLIDDAIYLKTHADAAAGSALILKYTGKTPSPVATPPRPTTPLRFQGFGSLRQRTLAVMSPTSSLRLQQAGGVEALLQGATKGVLERGEKLGINQAVREAMSEVRRNMRAFQESPSSRTSRSSLDEGPHGTGLFERRNRQLAAMLDESIDSLTQLVSTSSAAHAAANVETIQVATAQIQFVKVHLEHSSLALVEDDLPSISRLAMLSPKTRSPSTVALDTTPVIMRSSAVETVTSTLSWPEQSTGCRPQLETMPTVMLEDADGRETDASAHSRPPSPTSPATSPGSSHRTVIESPVVPAPLERPPGPIPTRSTLAQSSFSWMLDPATTSVPATSRPCSRPRSASRPKRASSTSRERKASLFGEVVRHDRDERHLSTDDMFGLEPWTKTADRNMI